MNPTMLCVLAFSVSVAFAAPRNLFRPNTMHNQRTTTINRQQEINQPRTRLQHLLTRMRNPVQFHRIRNAPSPMKKIQIDPHSRTVSIQAHGQPNIVLKSQRGLKLKIQGKAGQPSKVINVLFKNRPSAEIASTPVLQPQNPQPVRTPPNPSSTNSPGNALNTDSIPMNDHSKTRYVLLGQSSIQNSQGAPKLTGSGTGHQIRFLGDARATLEYLIRQKLISTLSQTPSTSILQNHMTSFATRATDNNSQIPQAVPVESSTVPSQPSTTYFPYDYETEEPEYPNNA